jgi:hypothetical protein
MLGIFDKLFSRKGKKLKPGELKVVDMPKSLNDLVNRLDLTKPKMCFMNSFLTVMQTLSKDEFDIHYVLVEITTDTGYKFDHAVIKWNGLNRPDFSRHKIALQCEVSRGTNDNKTISRRI